MDSGQNALKVVVREFLEHLQRRRAVLPQTVAITNKQRLGPERSTLFGGQLAGCLSRHAAQLVMQALSLRAAVKLNQVGKYLIVNGLFVPAIRCGRVMMGMPVQLFSLVYPATSQPLCCHHNASLSDRRDRSKTGSNCSNASGRKLFETACDLETAFRLRDRKQNSYPSHPSWASFVCSGVLLCMH